MIAVLKDDNKAYISRYALGSDYHKIIRKKLSTLAKQIEKEIKGKELLLHDVKNKSNAPFLNEVMEEISQLENEYFQYIEELDKLNQL